MSPQPKEGMVVAEFVPEQDCRYTDRIYRIGGSKDELISMMLRPAGYLRYLRQHLLAVSRRGVRALRRKQKD